MKKARERKDYQSNPVITLLKPVIIGAVAGAAVCMVLLIGCTFSIVSAKQLPQGLLQPITVVVAALGSFVAGYIAAKLSGCKGIFYGASSGLILFLLLLVAGLTVGDEMLTPVTATKGLIMMLTGAISGILAVNKKSRRK